MNLVYFQSLGLKRVEFRQPNEIHLARSSGPIQPKVDCVEPGKSQESSQAPYGYIKVVTGIPQ